MNYRRFLPLAVCALIVSACSKDNKNGSTELYRTANTLQIDQLAIYTQNGRITDRTFIQAYLDRNFDNADIKKKFYVNSTSVSDHDILKTLEFIADNKVQFNQRTLEIVQRTDTMLLLAELDSADVPPVKTAPCDKLLQQAPAITPATYCPQATCTRYRKTYPVLISGNQYVLPTLYYAVKHAEKKMSAGIEVTVSCNLLSQEYPMLNFVNKDLIGSLEAGDSVLVQTGRLAMVKN